jgi:hypothetical protein
MMLDAFPLLPEQQELLVRFIEAARSVRHAATAVRIPPANE